MFKLLLKPKIDFTRPVQIILNYVNIFNMSGFWQNTTIHQSMTFALLCQLFAFIFFFLSSQNT